MPRSATLAQMRTSVRLRGSYENSADITDAILTEYLNDGLAETWDMFLQSNDDRYSVLTTVPTIANISTIALPANFFKLRKVEILNGNVWVKLKEVDLDSNHLIRTVADKQYKYRANGSNLELYPTPVAVEQVRITYYPFFTKLALDADTFDGINGLEELAIKIALKHCYIRQDLGYGEIQADIDRLKLRVMHAIDARNAEPFYILPYRDLDDDEGTWR